MSDGVNEVGFSGDATGTYVRNGVVEAPRADDGEGTCSVCQGLCTEVDGREGKYYYCDRSTQVAVHFKGLGYFLYMQVEVNIEVLAQHTSLTGC